MVEMGHGIAALKADLFDKLIARLARDRRGSSRARAGAHSDRWPRENHGGGRGAG
jgi:hypothetical protein